MGTGTQAQKSILMALSLTVGLAFTARMLSEPTAAIRHPGSMLRIFVGGAAAALGLMTLANPAPEMAKLIAWLIAMGAFYNYGLPFLLTLSTVLNRDTWTVTTIGAGQTAPTKSDDPTKQAPKPPKDGGFPGGGGGWIRYQPDERNMPK